MPKQYPATTAASSQATTVSPPHNFTLGTLSWARLDRIVTLSSSPDTTTAYVVSHIFLPAFHVTNNTCLYRSVYPVQPQQRRARHPHQRHRRSKRRPVSRVNAQRLSRPSQETTAASSRATIVSPPLSCMLGTPFSALRARTVTRHSMLGMGTALRCLPDSISENASSEGVTELAFCTTLCESQNLGLKQKAIPTCLRNSCYIIKYTFLHHEPYSRQTYRWTD
jgi:hypothetical protein